MEPIDLTRDGDDRESITAAQSILRSLTQYGVEYVFANLGTDHTPFIEAAARLREMDSDASISSFVNCAHEFVALSAAHGYAVATGEPQAVLVHVDVGTQNLGGAIHNAHRANAPVFIIAGLAPSSDSGYLGSRSHIVHYLQDAFDQPGIVREYCRWTGEYKPPGSPEQVVRRGLERALAPPEGPTYLTATREALEAYVPPRDPSGSVRRPRPTGANDDDLAELTELIDSSSNPAVITSRPLGPTGTHDFEPLVRFAKASGSGVVEHAPTALCFPRDHPLHLGFDPTVAFEEADLVILTRTDIPWVPSHTAPAGDETIVQIDVDPTKGTYPHWPFEVDRTITADPYATFEALSDLVSSEFRSDRRQTWVSHRTRRIEGNRETVDRHVANGELTAAVVSSELSEFVDESTVIVDDGVTSSPAILEHLPLSVPGSYFWKGGSSIGWSVGAALGIKLSQPQKRVIAMIGDGSYLLCNPAASAVLADTEGLPILVVVLNNGGWNAVNRAVKDQHPNGAAVRDGVPESSYSSDIDLSEIATVIDAHTDTVTSPAHLDTKIAEAIDAVDNGQYAVLEVEVRSPSLS